MPGITRIAPFLVVLAVTAAPQAARGAKSCIGPSSPSALNQYCEDIPTSTGGTTPGAPGSSNVSATLPSPVARRIHATSTGDPVRRLLSIPTDNGRPRDSARVGNGLNPPAKAKVSTNVGDVKTNPSSIGLGLILVLALSALALVGFALERQRHTGAG